MSEILALIAKANAALEAKGAKNRVVVGSPQKDTRIASAEKKLRITFPEDYKRFVTEHGIISTLSDDGVPSEMYKMLTVSEMIEETGDLREDLTADIDEDRANRVVAFQYELDSRSQEYYVFAPSLSDGTLVVYDIGDVWARLADEEYVYAKTFTEHIGKWLDEFVAQASGR